jgi:hypothetical protein
VAPAFLWGGEINQVPGPLARPASFVSIFGSARCDCSIFSGWRDQTQAWFGHEKSPSRLPHCSIDIHFMNSRKMQNVDWLE